MTLAESEERARHREHLICSGLALSRNVHLTNRLTAEGEIQECVVIDCPKCGDSEVIPLPLWLTKGEVHDAR